MKILSQKTVGYTMGYYFWIMSGLVAVNQSRINCYLQLSRYDPRGYKGSRIQGFKGSSEMLKNYKDLKVLKKGCWVD
jgi:hypothetical protein